ESVRKVIGLMRDDALLAAHSDDPKRGIQAAHAALNAGRSIGDEPIMISQMVRRASWTVSTDAAMRVLALSDPKTTIPELSKLQAAFLAEAEEPVLVETLRGERAIVDRGLTNLDPWILNADILTRGREKPKHTRLEGCGYWALNCFDPDTHAKYLEM